jgi:uncharacterized membrane protein YgcG
VIVSEDVIDMKKFAIFAGLLMVTIAFAGLGAALDPLDKADAKADPDRDGLKNFEEFMYGTDPTNPDSDGAGCYDGWEVWYDNHRAVTSDGVEIISEKYHYDANDASDEGKVANVHTLIQVRDGDANVNVNDPDNDGWNNYHEFLVGSDPTNPNTDLDSFSLDSADPDPLIANEGGDGPGGNGGPGSGQGAGSGSGNGFGNGGGGSGI